MKKRFKNQGSALIVSIMILVIIVVIALSITLVSLQNKTASEGEYVSSRSFQTADTGIENLMYDLTKTGKVKLSDLDDCQSNGLIENNDYIITLLDTNHEAMRCDQDKPTSDVVSVKAVSKLNTQSRAVEADVICNSPFKADTNGDTLALYHFQEASGSDQISDSSGIVIPTNISGQNTDNSGTVAENGSLPTVSGICKARFFDGSSNDYIKVQGNNPTNHTLELSDSMTISAWVKISNGVTADWERIVGKGGDTFRNYDLGVSQTNGWEFKVNNGTVATSCDVSKSIDNPDEWHFIVGVYDKDASKIILYVDGSASSENCSLPAAVDTSDMTIGYSPGVTGSDYFQGTLDEISISKKAKSSGDINDEFTLGKIFHLP